MGWQGYQQPKKDYEWHRMGEERLDIQPEHPPSHIDKVNQRTTTIIPGPPPILPHSQNQLICLMT